MNSAPLFLASSHDPWIVLASAAIATLASYVTLDLSRRVRAAGGELHRMWWIAGSLVMGTGIWSMHFIGMLAFALPIRLGFTGVLTALSWLAAVLASSIALRMASAAHYSVRSVISASVMMAMGICGMHYVGMAALDMTVPIVWNPAIVALSVAIALVASAVALLLFRLLLIVRPERRFATQLLAAAIMGAAICGMHYTGMAAANFPEGTVCLSADALSGNGLTAILVVATFMLLMSVLLASILEARLQVIARRLAGSLQETNAKLATANDELKRRAFSDALTGLPNRQLLEDRLTQAVQRASRPHTSEESLPSQQQQLAVLFIDLDGFKPVNDSFGHAAGDAVLKATADRLAAAVRAGDTVARIGGDEFLVLLEGFEDAGECERLATHILEAICAPFDISGKSIQIACSIGVAVHQREGRSDRLIANADAAMYAAKRLGGSRISFFADHMEVDTSRQLELQSDLRKALERREFELYYQPKIDVRRNRVSGVEALIRWNHPRRGIVGPADFIPIAESSGLIVNLGKWVIDEACRQVAAWNREGKAMCVAINFSAYQLREPALVDDVRQALQRHGVAASRLLCEITESVAMQDPDITIRVFEGLLAIGVHLSIDDFGTGYSSLSQLRDLPARQLKIDRSFIQELESKENARAVVEAVIKLAHALHLSVVAEGVETAGQRDVLLKMGCDELQGFFYARPMQADRVASWSLDKPAIEAATPASRVQPTIPPAPQQPGVERSTITVD